MIHTVQLSYRAINHILPKLLYWSDSYTSCTSIRHHIPRIGISIYNHVNRHHVNRQCPSVQPNLLGSYCAGPITACTVTWSRVATKKGPESQPAISSRNEGFTSRNRDYESQQWFRFVMVCLRVATGLATSVATCAACASVEVSSRKGWSRLAIRVQIRM